ncbi:MAG: integrase core domain-containing protein [Prochlorococcaceae cyanobacterium]
MPEATPDPPPSGRGDDRSPPSLPAPEDSLAQFDDQVQGQRGAENDHPLPAPDGWEAEISLARFLWRYCHVRPHSSLGGRTPHRVYTENQPCSSHPGLTMSGATSVQ